MGYSPFVIKPSYFPDFHFTSLGKISLNTSKSPASSPRSNAISRSSLSLRYPLIFP